MNEVHYRLIYPRVDRVPSVHSEKQRVIDGHLNIGCSSWKTNTAMRKGFCDLLFAGCGNHPGLWDGVEGHPFDSGDQGINNVHRQWAVARTRSMSVGDVVCIDPAGLCEFWLCDSVGWVLLNSEQVKSWLQFPRKYGCCSFELSQWLKKQTS
jgi:hypothetical protein